MVLFIVNACAEIHGAKLNLELAFNNRPSLQDLVFRVEEAFEVAQDFHDNKAGEDFHAATMSVYSKAQDQWSLLTNTSQLENGTQIYVFQTTTRAMDKIGALPAPVLPPSATRSRHPSAIHKAPSDVRPMKVADRQGSTTVIMSPNGKQGARANSSVSLSPSSGSRRTLKPSKSDLVAANLQRVPSLGDIPEVESDGASTSHSHPNAGGFGASSSVAVPGFGSGPPGDGSADCRVIFNLLDEEALAGEISLGQLRDAMLGVEMDVSERSVGDTFSHGDQRITVDEFVGFGSAYPAIARELRTRLEALKRQRTFSSTVPAITAPPAPSVISPPLERPRPVSSRIVPPSSRPPPDASRSLEASLEAPRRRDSGASSILATSPVVPSQSRAAPSLAPETRAWLSSSPTRLSAPTVPPPADLRRTSYESSIHPGSMAETRHTSPTRGRPGGAGMASPMAAATSGSARTGSPYRHDPHALLSRGAPHPQLQSTSYGASAPLASSNGGMSDAIERLMMEEGRLMRELEAVRRERSMLEAAERTQRATAATAVGY